MTKCFYCQVDFPLLPNTEGQDEIHLKCGKCQIRKPGLSAPELAAINVCRIYIRILLKTFLTYLP
jgi:hypothetical protein